MCLLAYSPSVVSIVWRRSQSPDLLNGVRSLTQVSLWMLVFSLLQVRGRLQLNLQPSFKSTSRPLKCPILPQSRTVTCVWEWEETRVPPVLDLETKSVGCVMVLVTVNLMPAARTAMGEDVKTVVLVAATALASVTPAVERDSCSSSSTSLLNGALRRMNS